MEIDLMAEEAARAEQLKGRRLLCEIPFEKDDIDKLQQSLLPQGIEAWNRTPTLAAMMTVGLGVYYYDRGDFWKPFTSSNSLVDQSIWGKKFEGFLDRHYLETFRSIKDEHGHRYVATILAHGGIPQTCLPDFFCLMTDSGDSAQSGHDLIDILKNSPKKLNLADQPIKRFLKYGGEVAEDFVSRFLELWQCYERGEMVANFSLLPGRVVKEFSVWWPENKPTKRDSSKRLPRPDLRIEPAGCGVFLHLPRCDNHPDVGANGRWRALGQDWATTREHEIPLKPDIKWEVSIVRRTYTLIGATGESPILFFDKNTGKQIPEHSLRLPTQVWALFSGDLQADPSPIADESFSQWPGYRLAEFDLSNKRQLRIGSGTFDVRRPFFDYADDPSVRGVQGCDRTQVFSSLPKIEWEGIANLSLTKDGRWQGYIDIESDGLPVLLDKPGDYEIDLRGPLGESIHRRFLLIPGLTVQPSPEVMWPNQKVIKWHLSTETGSIKSGDTLPPFIRYDSAVEFEVVYSDYEIGGLCAEVPPLRWRLPYSQESGEWSNKSLPPVWLDDLKEADYPTLECNFGLPREDVAVTLVGRHSASEFEAKRQRSGDQSSWYFDLRRVRDELEAAGRSEEFELLIRSKNGAEYFRGKVLSVRSRWHMENFIAEWKKVNEQHVINVAWREPDRPITGRWLVVIPLWKPWGGAVLQHPFDSAGRSGYVWRLPLPDLQPGRYMLKAVHAPWGSDDWIEAQAVCQQAIDVYKESWPESFGSQQMTPTVEFYLQALLAHWYRPQLVKKPPMPPVGLEEKDILLFLDGLRLADNLEHIKIPKDGSGSLNIFCINPMATTEAYKSLQQQPLAKVWTRVLPCPEVITLEPSESDKSFIREVATQYTTLKTAARGIKHAHKQRRLSGILLQWHKNLGKESPPVDEVIFLCEKFLIFEHESPAWKKREYEQLKSEYQSREAV